MLYIFFFLFGAALPWGLRVFEFFMKLGYGTLLLLSLWTGAMGWSYRMYSTIHSQIITSNNVKDDTDLINETLKVYGKPIDEVYRDCLSWFNSIGAELEKKSPNDYILAYHELESQDNPSSLPEDWAKIFEVTLTQMTDCVDVSLGIDTGWKKTSLDRYKNRIRAWKHFVGDFGLFLGAEVTQEQLAESKNFADKVRKDKRMNRWINYSGLIILFFMSLYALTRPNWEEKGKYAMTLLFSLVFLMYEGNKILNERKLLDGP